MAELSLQDLCFALEQRQHGEFPGSEPLDPRVPANICEVTPTSAIDCAVVENLCPPESRAARICGPEGGPGQVQGNVGRPQVAQLTRVPLGPGVPFIEDVSFIPCPTPIKPTFIVGGTPVQVPSGSNVLAAPSPPCGVCVGTCTC